MKKWLLLSAILNILILQIPLSDRKVLEKEKEGSKLKLNLSVVHLSSAKVNNTELPSNNNSSLFSEKKQVDINELHSKNTEYKNDIENESTNYKVDNIQNKSQEIVEDKTVTAKNESIIIPDSKEAVIKSSDTFSDSVLILSDNSKNNSSGNETKEKIEIFEKDENILTKGSVNLVKENSDLKYKIIRSKTPVYPTKAQILNLKENVKVSAEFTVDTNGDVKDISLFSDFSKYKKFEFDKAVENALHSYKFSPILYKNEIVEVRFKKVFEFNVK